MMRQKSLIIKKQAIKKKNNQHFFPQNTCRLNKSHYLCTRNQEITDSQTRIDSLAQQVEHNTFNVGVLGSSPRRITQEQSQTATKKRQVLQYQRIVGLFFMFQSCLKDRKGSRKDTVEYLIRTPFPENQKGGTIVEKWLTFGVICLPSIYLIFND